MTWGIMEAIVNKLGGEEGAKAFLRGTVETKIKKTIINWLGTTKTTATTKKFIAKDKFKLKRNGGICSFFGVDLQSWFFTSKGKIENPLKEQELRFGELTTGVVHRLIIEELGGEAKAETTLTEMFDQMSKQSKGEEGNLLTNNWANIFYIRDINGVLRAVLVHWENDWCIMAYSIEQQDSLYDEVRVFSRNS